MPLGIVSDEDFLAEAIHIDIKHGRPNGRSNTPEIIREIVAESAIEGEDPKVLAGEFGISCASISAYKHDATSTSTYHESSQPLKKANDVVRSRIIEGARGKLLAALDSLTPDKLEKAKARDLAGIAKDMSAVMNNVEPVGSINNPGAQFVFHVPAPKKEDDYEIINVTS